MTTLPLWLQPVTYGAIGGTRAVDLTKFPPRGYRPIRVRRRIGHGANRFSWASAQVMSWGIQRRSGFDVAVQETPDAVMENTYTPVAFDEAGVPIEQAGVGDAERTFGADGSAYLVPGDTAVLTIRFLFIPVGAPVRVVYVVAEPDRAGFAYGTLEGHPESGEESFIVEKTADGSVWLEISAFSRLSALKWRLVAPAVRIAQSMYIRRYLRVLAGPTT